MQRFSDQYTDGVDTSTEQGEKEGQKSIANLLVEQVEFANVIILNKIDLVTDEQQRATIKLIQTLNPVANILPTEYAKLDTLQGTILNTRLFDMKKASESTGWLQIANSVWVDDDVTLDITIKYSFIRRLPLWATIM